MTFDLYYFGGLWTVRGFSRKKILTVYAKTFDEAVVSMVTLARKLRVSK